MTSPPSNRPIRVVHVMPHIGVGGAERQLRYLALHSDRHELTHAVAYYYVLDEAELRRFQESGIALRRVSRDQHHPIRFVRDLARAIRERQPDVVHCWLVSGGIWGRLAAMWAGCGPILAAYRNTEVFRPGVVRWVERLTRNRMHYLANSRACARAVARTVGVPFERFNVVYNGVESFPRPQGDEREHLRRSLDVPAGHKTLVMVGRLTPQKNYPMLLRIAQRAKGVLPIRFVVAGHGELREELLGLAESMGVADVVHFAGLRGDIPSILAAADIFCFTTLYEGFPNVLLEAMSAGCPIVTTKFDGVDELIEDGATGRIVPLDDDAAAFEALRQLVQDPALASRLGQAAAAAVAERFSLQRMVEETVAVYRKMLGERACRGGCGCAG